MDQTAVVALITGLTGVGGAIVGASGTLLGSARAERSARERRRREALVEFWAAVSSHGALMATLADLLPEDARFDQRIRQGFRVSGHVGRIIDRQFVVTDRLWASMARVRIVATAEDLAAIRQVEDAVGEWKMGREAPETFAPAIQHLRRVIESLGPAGQRALAAGSDESATEPLSIARASTIEDLSAP